MDTTHSAVLGGHQVWWRLQRRRGDWPPGSGSRGLRAWMSEDACCTTSRGSSQPMLERLADGRTRCTVCGCWFSASHSDNVMVLVRSVRPVGVDVQYERRRPAAMRKLAVIIDNPHASIVHWTLAETVLKAAGRASQMPLPGSLVLPSTPPAGAFDVVLPDGVSLTALTWVEDRLWTAIAVDRSSG